VITVIGEAIIDLVDGGDGTTFQARPGGSPYNVAIATARLEAPTRLLARFGRDKFGMLLRSHALASGVDLSVAADAAQPSTLAITSIDEQGGATYDFYVDGTADWHWTDAELDVFGESSIVHFGSLASWTPPGDATIRNAIARSHALVTYDPNVRPRLAGHQRHARNVIEQNVALADVVKASEEDLHWLYPDVPHDEVATRWLSGRPSLVLITTGLHGATAYRARHEPVHRAARSVSVVDSVGAGDSWMGSILAGLHSRGVTTAESIRALSAAQISDLLDTAMVAASLACRRRGADPPTAGELAMALRADARRPA
jgi:fructokinase